LGLYGVGKALLGTFGFLELKILRGFKMLLLGYILVVFGLNNKLLFNLKI
jgi:hypothetical protein